MKNFRTGNFSELPNSTTTQRFSAGLVSSKCIHYRIKAGMLRISFSQIKQDLISF